MHSGRCILTMTFSCWSGREFVQKIGTQRHGEVDVYEKEILAPRHDSLDAA